MGIMCDICNKRIKEGSSDHVRIFIEKYLEAPCEDEEGDDLANVPGTRKKIRFDLHSECYKDKIEKELVK